MDTTQTLPQLASMDDVTIEIARDMVDMINTARVGIGDMLERFALDRDEAMDDGLSNGVDDPHNRFVDFCNGVSLCRTQGSWSAARY